MKPGMWGGELFHWSIAVIDIALSSHVQNAEESNNQRYGIERLLYTITLDSSS